MAIASLVIGACMQYVTPVSTCCTMSSPIVKVNTHKLVPCISRRVGAIAVMTSLFLTTEAIMSDKTAKSLDLRITVPDQTVEEAQSVVRDHAQGLLDVKSLLDSEYWRDAQQELRKNSSYLKQDFYTIIQSKEGSARPLLRRLYAKLFNNVTKLDYAARDKDVARVQECYNNVAAALNDFLSRI
ncbi:psbQ-like protein 3, chloroplastic [Chenopodium quinoa]|uniref:psbQ-like protein 3, chloroplastic n=1 Tax=Chenopodium quinoa TaxID=63459 RepID=UPI000B7821A1|nr:psbQ-like protein 3, chloroplastic [Chenopodium quinoa]XP_021742020.1 psbQ-like protein 3, chloroplastic [Chenopodium quinoa]